MKLSVLGLENVGQWPPWSHVLWWHKTTRSHSRQAAKTTMDQHSRLDDSEKIAFTKFRYYFGRSSRLPGRESRCHHEIQFWRSSTTQEHGTSSWVRQCKILQISPPKFVPRLLMAMKLKTISSSTTSLTKTLKMRLPHSLTSRLLGSSQLYQ